MIKENIIEILVEETKKYIKSQGLRAGILGISGGIDSTLVACILHEVSKELNEEGYTFEFYGRSIPTFITNEKEFKISILVGEAFCDNFKATQPGFMEVADEFYQGIEEIEGSEQTYNIRSGEEPVKETRDKLRRGNIKSRLRAVYLYDLAKLYKGIVIGTDNYTEYLLGFSTIGGDALFDFCPIQYLWKTEVYKVAEKFKEKYLGEKDYLKVAALQRSIEIPPQDGLGISECDLDQIGGNSYDEVDKVLNALISGEKSVEGIEQEVFDKIEARWKGSEYKRHHPVRLGRDIYEGE